MKTIEIDDDIYERLQNLAIAFVETNPNMVIRRIVDHYLECENKAAPAPQDSKRRVSKRGYGKLSSKRYRKPIIEALEELGGKGTVDEVLDLVFKKVELRLTAIDYEKTQIGLVRWRSTALWERYQMMKDGIIESNSPRGVWILNTDFNKKSSE